MFKKTLIIIAIVQFLIICSGLLYYIGSGMGTLSNDYEEAVAIINRQRDRYTELNDYLAGVEKENERLRGVLERSVSGIGDSLTITGSLGELGEQAETYSRRIGTRNSEIVDLGRELAEIFGIRIEEGEVLAKH